MLPIAVVVVAQMAIAPLLAALLQRSRGANAVAIVLAAIAACAPWLVAPVPIARTWLTLVGALLVLHAIDLARDRQPWSFAMRFWVLTSPFDARQARPAGDRFRPATAAAFVGYALASAAGVEIALRSPELVGWARLAARSLACALLALGVVGGGAALYRIGYRAFGVEVPAVQNAPLVSRTLVEFWSVRWNRTVRSWLRRHVFMPVARRAGVAAGVLATFVASAVLHFWIALTNAGLLGALSMASFFVVHGVLVLIEARTGLRGRVWTFLCFVATLPLFADPLLAMLGL